MRLRAALLGTVLLAFAPAAASAEPILAAEDSAELANSLAEAREEQGVCYGWFVRVDDESGGPSGDDIGSDQGPGRQLDPTQCREYVQLTAVINYTSESSEIEDSATIEVDETLPGTITADDLSALGYGKDELMGDEDDTTLMNMVGALPSLAAERANLKPVPFESPEAPAPQQGQPTDSPGSDFIRKNLALLTLGSILLVLGIAWLVLDWGGWLRPGLQRVGRAMDES